MANRMLEDVLSNAIAKEAIIEWLSTPKSMDSKFPCSRGEFVSHFINFIHKEALSCEQSGESTRILHTPKLARKLEVNCKPRRRQALFQDRRSTPVSPIHTFHASVDVSSPSTSKSLCLGDFISPRQSPSIEVKHRSRIRPTNLSKCSGTIPPPGNSFDFTRSEEVFTPPKSSIPDVDSVPEEHRPRLRLLAAIYVHLIHAKLTLNIVSEFHFILSLLLAQHLDDAVFTSTTFTTIHHVVFFAIESLRNLILLEHDLLVHLLDASTLRALRTHHLTADCMWEKLEIADFRPSVDIIFSGSPSPGVCFDSDTDNRDHFPTDASFHAFRKQRDLFYELRHVWRTEHQVPSVQLRALLTMHSDPANFRHLSRLCVAQMLVDGVAGAGAMEPPATLAGRLSAKKLHRLQSRLTMTGSDAAMEFYQELIISAQNAIFSSHMRNTLIGHLMEANGIDVDEQTRGVYVQTMRTMQMLARFIAVLDMAPYTRSTSISHRLQVEEMEARSTWTPSIHLHHEFTAARRDGRICIVIPWLAEYLGGLDAATLRLPYFHPLYNHLFHLYLHSHQTQLNATNRIYVDCCLGTLFELPHFPSELYFTYISTNTQEMRNSSNSSCVDLLPIVSDAVLHALCPQILSSVRKLLKNDAHVTSKHIVPISTQPEDTSNEQKLRLQLEDALLGCKPTSVRRTVDFVSERIASSIVKTICNRCLPETKTSLIEQRNALLLKEENDEESTKTTISQMIETHLQRLLESSDRILRKQLEEKIPSAMTALMSCEEDVQTIVACTRIAKRTCEQRVRQWIIKHVNMDLLKEFHYDSERIFRLRKKLQALKYKTLPTEGNPGVAHIDSDEENHEMAVWSPSKLLTKLQQACSVLSQSFAEETCPLAEDDVQVIVAHARHTRRHRCDLSEMCWHLVNRLLMDLLILCAATCLGNELIAKFMQFWEDGREEDAALCKDVFQGALSVRNVQILNAHRRGAERKWRMYADILGELLRRDFLAIDDFETQCLSVFRQEWDAEMLTQFSLCLQHVERGNNSRFTFLLSFLADYCSDLEF